MSFPIPKYSIGETVYVKSVPNPSVTRGVVSAAEVKVWSTDAKGKATKHMIEYRLTVSDRRDGGFVHMMAPEIRCYPSWEAAWWEERE